MIAGTVIAREVQDVANRVEDEFTENSAGVTPADKRLSNFRPGSTTRARSRST